MATVTVVTLADSLDERIKNGVETVTFFHPVFGTQHEIELGETNQKHFMAHLEKLQKYIDASREVVQAKPAKTPATNKSDLTAVREWAKANGYTVGDRGRIKAEIVQAYNVAQADAGIDKLRAKGEKLEAQSVVDSDDLVEVEFSDTEVAEDEQHVLTDEEILALMDKVDSAGEDVTLDKLVEASQQQ